MVYMALEKYLVVTSKRWCLRKSSKILPQCNITTHGNWKIGCVRHFKQNLISSILRYTRANPPTERLQFKITFLKVEEDPQFFLMLWRDEYLKEMVI